MRAMQPESLLTPAQFPYRCPCIPDAVEKEAAASPRILRGVSTDIRCHTVHVHVRYCPFQRFVICRQNTYVYAVPPQKLLMAVFVLIILRITHLEAVDEAQDIVMGAMQHKMNMVRHENECKYAGRADRSLHRYIIHSDFEIFIIPEPETIFEMLGSYEPELFLLPHILQVPGTDRTRNKVM
ncbi:MAG: hypothetical protein IKI13_00965 [Bacteroidales bacterium]|nr:hypothetical protein [Bacteroidales bacterium]